MGNSSSTKNLDIAEPGAPTNSSSNEGQIEGETYKKQIAAPKVIGSASEYALSFKAEPQNGQFTYDEQVDKFYSQIVVEAPKFETTSRPSLDIVAVLDVSGSMSGQKISLVRKSMRRLIRNLGSQDRVCLVTFDSRVETVMDFCTLNEGNKQRAYDIISGLKAGTSTALCGGVVEGVQQLLNNRVNDVASVLLFTDGQANVGFRDTTAIVNEVLRVSGAGLGSKVEEWSVEQVSQWLRSVSLPMYCQGFAQQGVDGSILKFDITKEMLTETLNVQPLHASKLFREIEKLRGTTSAEGEKTGDDKVQGFRLHTFGFGSNHNANLLQQLAESFDGMYFFMENEDAIKSGFANCLGGLMTTVALNIEVAVQFNPECKDGKIYKDNVTVLDDIHTVTFADLQSEEKRNILVSCTMPAKEAPVPDFLLYEVNMKYKNAIADNESRDVCSCIVDRSGKEEDFNEEVDETRNRELAAIALREANALGEKNDLKAARNRLQITIDEIDTSRSAHRLQCKNLASDLRVALDKTTDLSTFKNEGVYYMAQNATCFQQQRACNFQAEVYASQDLYNTSAKREMDEVWSRADSLDSCCDDDSY